MLVVAGDMMRMSVHDQVRAMSVHHFSQAGTAQVRIDLQCFARYRQPPTVFSMSS